MINWRVEIIENARVIFYYQTRNILLQALLYVVCTDTDAVRLIHSTKPSTVHSLCPCVRQLETQPRDVDASAEY